jgi:hypothetical protein
MRGLPLRADARAAERHAFTAAAHGCGACRWPRGGPLLPRPDALHALPRRVVAVRRDLAWSRGLALAARLHPRRPRRDVARPSSGRRHDGLRVARAACVRPAAPSCRCGARRVLEHRERGGLTHRGAGVPAVRGRSGGRGASGRRRSACAGGGRSGAPLACAALRGRDHAGLSPCSAFGWQRERSVACVCQPLAPPVPRNAPRRGRARLRRLQLPARERITAGRETTRCAQWPEFSSRATAQRGVRPPRRRPSRTWRRPA